MNEKDPDSPTTSSMSGEGGKGCESCPAQTLSGVIRGKGPLKTAGH